MEIIGIVYLTTCLVNGKVYVGQHKVKNKETLDPKYLGSGANLIRAINKYGKENFKREILKLCYTETQMNVYELYFSKKCNDALDYDIGYNLCHGVIKVSGNRNPACLQHVRDKISKSLIEFNKNNPEARLKFAHIGENNPNFGKHWSQEVKDKLSANHADMKGVNNPNFGKHWGKEWLENQSFKMKAKMIGENHPMWGKTHSLEAIEKIRQARLGTKASEETKAKLSKVHKGEVKSEEHKKKIGDSQRGEKCKLYGSHLSQETKEKLSKSLKGKNIRDKSKNFGKHWITNGVENKLIFIDEIESGWYLGRTINNR
jgi:group I intron endonuclease